jgi:hypothetical protein
MGHGESSSRNAGRTSAPVRARLLLLASISERRKGEAIPFTSVTRTRDGGLTLFRVRGEATPSVFIDAFRDFLADPTRLALWDMRGCRVARLDHDQLRRLVGGLMRCDHSRRPRGRTAFVCRSEADRNAMRLLVAFAEATKYPTDMAVFGNVTQAQRWLTQD